MVDSGRRCGGAEVVHKAVAVVDRGGGGMRWWTRAAVVVNRDERDLGFGRKYVGPGAGGEKCAGMGMRVAKN
jgi:hypothetical protein